MTAIDTVAAALLASRLDSLLGEGVAPAAAGGAAAQIGKPAARMPAAAADPAVPELPAASAQASLSEIALALEAIARGGEAPPAVLGTTPLLPVPPAQTAQDAQAAQAAARGASASAASADDATLLLAALARDPLDAAPDAAGLQRSPLDPASRSASAAAAAASVSAFPAASGTAQALFGALTQAVSESGLFYEAHLADWLAGARGTAELAREPQTRLTRGTPNPARARADVDVDRAASDPDPYAWLDDFDTLDDGRGSGAAQQNASAGPNAGGAAAARGPSPFTPFAPGARERDTYAAWPGASGHARPSAMQDGALPGDWPAGGVHRLLADAASGAATSASGAAPGSVQAKPPALALPGGVDPATLPLVRQQLELLATQQFRWSGEAWPGARLDWTIEPDQGRAGDEQDASGAAWCTRVTLSLPVLGTVDAELRLSGSRIVARLRANASGAARLAAHEAALRERFEAAGLQVGDVSIGVGDAAPSRFEEVFAQAAAAAAYGPKGRT